jgi:hypothetical protein
VIKTKRSEFEKEVKEQGYVLDDSMHYYTEWKEFKKWHPTAEEEE